MTLPKFDAYYPLLLDVVMQRSSMATVGQQLKLSRYNLKKLLDKHIPFFHKVEHHNQVRIIKNLDFRYVDFNNNATKLGQVHHHGRMKNLTDFDITPEFAHEYRQMDLDCLQHHTLVTHRTPVVFESFGQVMAIGKSSPIYDHAENCIGFFVSGDLDLSLKDQSFPEVYEKLTKGLAHHFLQKDKYTIQFDRGEVILSHREVELILYVLIGISAKRIAQHMAMSPRTVESALTLIKQRFDAGSSNELINKLMCNRFINQL